MSEHSTNNPQPVNLERLERLCKGDLEKKQLYLRRFLELVPRGVDQIQTGLRTTDGELVRQTIHFLVPQLVFFGIAEFSEILEKLGPSPDQATLAKLRAPIEQAVEQVQKAVFEIEKTLNDLLQNSNQ
ncbi:MAG: hypothetical protein H6574_25410 [Lewinellaceae bacterium]|nr:hypothetical protein [Saprospiraceae bacterium]MCB9334399.1 hypothetical protein [Lewinellaceae bacterium]